MLDNFPLVLIPLLPLAGAVINLSIGKRLGPKGAGTLGCLMVFLSALLGWRAFSLLYAADHAGSLGSTIHGYFFDADWIKATELTAAASIHVRPGLVFDHLSAVMVLVITNIGFLIHLYSTAYMEHDDGISRFFGYLNLFTGSMLILVLGDSLPVTFVGWEGVGLCSYLLIGFWYGKDANANAGRKAFIVNRIGDFGFLLGMFMIFSAASTLNYSELASKADLLRAPFLLKGATYATFAGLLLFVGACGKSAQFPLYVWLPDAMAGPTPVSALIHAATMVTAGVYMIARLHFVFELDATVLAVIACVGAFTALFAATMGITARAIKKILAYSTVSQLGFMFIGVGTGAYSAGVFHLVTHACFKAGLFLGAGSIMHALANEEDVLKMGGLAKKLPITRITYLVYCLAIAGIFPFAGFFSKDAILAGAFDFTETVRHLEHVPALWPEWLGMTLYGVGLVAAACTAFYMFRSYFLVFSGTFRGDPHVYEHAHESPSAMTLPLVVLAILSVGVGFLGMPHVMGHNYFDAWLMPVLSRGAEAAVEMPASREWMLMGIATLVSASGIGLAFALYGRGLSATAGSLAHRFRPIYNLLLNKYWIDEIYDAAIVRPLRKTAFFLWKVVDNFVIDLVFVRGSAIVVDLTGRIVRYLQNGDVQRGVVGVLVGTVAIVWTGANWTAFGAVSSWHLVGLDGLTARTSGNDVTVIARGTPPSVRRPLEYRFDFGDGTRPVVQTGTTAGHRYEKAGKHTIVVEATDPRWRTSSSSSITVVVPPAGAPQGSQR